ncbi:MAG TPA: alpha/beta hydrolase [Saprospiraceae bacterium]|nr:alpha/beta hydrolase [Saprospiraceae bacterium]
MKRLFYILLFISCFSGAKGAIENAYIELKNDGIEIGTFDSNFFKNQQKEFFLYSELQPEKISLILLGKEQKTVLYYFHCMWGNFLPYRVHTQKKLNELSGVDEIVSVIWSANELLYPVCWNRAVKKGEKISSLFEALLSDSLKTNFILCHSMGHRIFEGLMSGMPPEKPLNIQSVIFAAADLDTDVFSKNLRILKNSAAKIVIYMHRRDALLAASQLILGRDRLGLHAHKYLDTFENQADFEIIDITESKNGNLFSLTNHLYFKNHRGVFSDIQSLILNDTSARAEHLTALTSHFKKMN